MKVEITSEKVNDILIIKIQGRVDTQVINNFESEITRVVKDGNIKLAVDLSEMDYINSSGLRAFLVTAKRIKKSGGKLVLFGLKPNVQEIFKMTGFSNIIAVTATREDALKAVG